MKVVKIIPLIMILQSCFPSFTPKMEIKKEIQQENILLKWVDVVGILDQDFPDYITIQKGKQEDTLCESHNVADLKFENNQITIGFYGSPQRYTKPIEIPDSIMGYEILIDTTYTTNSLTAPRKFYKKED